jgi:hypothetical protein
MVKKIKPLFNELPPIKASEEEISMSYEEIEKWFNEVFEERDKNSNPKIVITFLSLEGKQLFDKMLKESCEDLYYNAIAKYGKES